MTGHKSPVFLARKIWLASWLARIPLWTGASPLLFASAWAYPWCGRRWASGSVEDMFPTPAVLHSKLWVMHGSCLVVSATVGHPQCLNDGLQAQLFQWQSHSCWNILSCFCFQFLSFVVAGVVFTAAAAGTSQSWRTYPRAACYTLVSEHPWIHTEHDWPVQLEGCEN